MPPSEPLRVFISYARKDGTTLAQRLQSDLTKQGFDPWLDTQRIAGGATWTTKIEDAIDKAQYVLALLTTGSYVSEICRAEQLRSLRKGKCVIPIKAQAKTDIPLHLEAKNYRDFSDPAQYEPRFAALLRDIHGNVSAALPERYRSTPLRYLTAPPRVANYLERPEALRALRDTLFAEDHRQPIALTALAGMGGIGKTVLAKALTDDEVVREAFPDGIVWITAGKERKRDFIAEMREVAKALGDDLSGYDNDLACENQYRTTIAGKAALIVVDDVWSKADIWPLLAQSPRSRFLFTTRDAAIGRFVGAREHRADLLDVAQSRELLASWANVPVAELPAAAAEVIAECGRLPLALSVVGATLRGTDVEFWTDTLDLLRRADLSAIQEQLPEGQDSFFKAVEVSIQSLKPEMQVRYKALAVVLEDMAVPLPILQTLWNVSEAEARFIAKHFVDRSLAQRGDTGKSIRLHSLQLDYVRAQHEDEESLALILGAVRLSSNVIGRDPWQFASQMVGRLVPYQDMPAIERFTKRVAEGTRIPWLLSMQPALHPAGTALVRTLEGHAGPVRAVAVMPDGQRALSASDDMTLKVWDLASGHELNTLTGHGDYIRAVAVTRDGQHAVSASYGTLKVWDLGSGRVLRTFTGHMVPVYAVAVTPDGRLAVSASADWTLKVWDLGSGRELRTLTSHTGPVYAVVVTPDGQRAVSASEDKTLKVWELASGRELRTLAGHTDGVAAVAVTPDGQRAVSASEDKTLKVWELASGRELRTLAGHASVVDAVAVTPDGRLVVSGSADNTLKVWELEGGRELRTLTGHTGHRYAVYAVAVTPDGQRAVSAAGDDYARRGELKVWDLARGRELRALTGHSWSVTAVAVTPDGQRAVSASDDETLKVWELASGRELRTLTGHTRRVTAVAVAPDGHRAVSASWDQTLKVWDLESGRELRTLKGHSDCVNGVAVTADGQRAVSASNDKTLKVWDLASGRELHTLIGHEGDVTAVAVTPDGQRSVSASRDKTFKVWDLVSGCELRTLRSNTDWVMAVAVTPDGQQVVSASADNTLKVWELESGRELRTLIGHTSGVTAVALTPDGQLVVSASWDNTLKLWDFETAAVLATFTCDCAAYGCAFSDALKLLVGGDAGGHVLFLRLEEPKSKT